VNPPPLAADDTSRDLGLGGRIAQMSQTRLMNRDGSFNVRRRGLSVLEFIHPYHKLLTISWPAFFLLTVASYFASNVAFAFAYLACGEGALAGGEASTFGGRFFNAFFFSVQTLATIGYGKITPAGILPNLVVSVEALAGLLGFALATGLLFARFSRPTAKIVFSSRAVIAPYRGGTGLMFRIANGRSNELTGVSAAVTLIRMETHDGKRSRKFHSLNLERTKVMFLALQWVVVHPMDESSPLWNVTEEEFFSGDPELAVLLTAVDETFSQTVLSRSSYKTGEMVWGARFRDIYETEPDGRVAIDVNRLGEIDPAGL
jgi:inward rectifier potassium channel